MTLDVTSLLKKIEEAAQGLLFPSESDFPIEAFSYGEQEPTPEALLARSGTAAKDTIEQVELASFFEGLTEAAEDASENDRKSAERFRALVELIQTNLSDVRVYRLGQTDIEALVLGRHESGTWMGVRTNLVET